ncbi:hypothetical protein HY991_00515 [Candidatus Micrarchaeota archaeon]|nr:hypothetical protein [Candidatus Micrarchaeota archaeon]
MRNETAIIIGITVFLVAFLAVQHFFPRTEYVVDGIRILSKENPKNAIARIAGRADVVMKLEAPGENSSNICVIQMASEITKALASVNKTPAIYANDANSTKCLFIGNKSVDCPDGSTKGLILVQMGSCNCIKIEGSVLEINGDKRFMCETENAKKISSMIGYAVSG